MMPEYKPVRLSAVLISMLALSGCSALNFLNVDAVNDSVNYQKTASSIKALAIPPGLSDPGFDGTYASVQTQSGSTGSASVQQVQDNSAAVSSSVQNNPATTLASKSASAVTSNASSGRGVSLGAALLAESGTAVEQEPMSAPASSARAAASTAQTRQASAVQAQKSKPATAPRRSGNPQVAMMRLNSGEPALAVNAPYTRTWSTLAPILSAVGLQVTKKQSDQGIYTTVYQGQSVANIESGKTYLILVAENASRQSFIGVANEQGKPVSDPIANAVLNRLKTEFER